MHGKVTPFDGDIKVMSEYGSRRVSINQILDEISTKSAGVTVGGKMVGICKGYLQALSGKRL